MMKTPNCPITHYKQFVAEELQKPPYQWAGRAAHVLVDKYSELINSMHSDCETPDIAAGQINLLHMRDTQPKAYAGLPDMNKIAIKRVKL